MAGVFKEFLNQSLFKMSHYLIKDLLTLYFDKCDCSPNQFVSNFDESNYLIGFNYWPYQRKVTHISNSFREILGYETKNVLNSEILFTKILHPGSIKVFHEFLYTPRTLGYTNFSILSSFKLQAHHIHGYWKCFLVYCIDYFNDSTNDINSFGLMVESKRASEFFNQTNQGASFHQCNGSDLSNRVIEDKSNHKLILSEREKEVLKLISVGFITKEIADKLNICSSTVISHRKNLMEKLEAKNTAHLVKQAADRFLLNF